MTTTDAKSKLRHLMPPGSKIDLERRLRESDGGLPSISYTFWVWMPGMKYQKHLWCFSPDLDIATEEAAQHLRRYIKHRQRYKPRGEKGKRREPRGVWLMIRGKAWRFVPQPGRHFVNRIERGIWIDEDARTINVTEYASEALLGAFINELICDAFGLPAHPGDAKQAA